MLDWPQIEIAKRGASRLQVGQAGGIGVQVGLRWDRQLWGAQVGSMQCGLQVDFGWVPGVWWMCCKYLLMIFCLGLMFHTFVP